MLELINKDFKISDKYIKESTEKDRMRSRESQEIYENYKKHGNINILYIIKISGLMQMSLKINLKNHPK